MTMVVPHHHRYSLLRDVAVTRKHAAAGTKASRHSRQEELPIGASLLVAALAGAGNVLLTNPIWCAAAFRAAATSLPS